MRQVNLHFEAIKPYYHLAFAYFSTWAYTSFDTVDISPGGYDGDLVACFSNKENSSRYVIGAVWDETNQKFSYHS